MSKEELRREVYKYLTGEQYEVYEMVYILQSRSDGGGNLRWGDASVPGRGTQAGEISPIPFVFDRVGSEDVGEEGI